MRAPYRVRADMARLDDERAVPSSVDPGPATVFRGDRTWPGLLAERLDALEAAPSGVRAVDAQAADDTLRIAGACVARHAAAELPSRVSVERGAVVLHGLGLRVTKAGAVEHVSAGEAGPTDALPDASLRVRAQALLRDRPPQLRTLEALALALQEDLVLIGPAGPSDEGCDEHGTGRVSWLHVAFPSGWDPGSMAGASFERLHAPVPEADALRRAATALVQAMLRKGPFVRYVWGLSPDGARARHPRHAQPMPPDHPLDAAWLRVERQTTLALPEAGAAMFAIGVHVTPLSEALAAPDRRAAFADAVASLTPAMRRYKGVPWDEVTVRAWCRSLP